MQSRQPSAFPELSLARPAGGPPGGGGGTAAQQLSESLALGDSAGSYTIGWPRDGGGGGGRGGRRQRIRLTRRALPPAPPAGRVCRPGGPEAAPIRVVDRITCKDRVA